ncbi:MAG: site-2 protease family protein [Veillonella sp.]|uniref:site-2 protease family protein n=1 Tax=Veillonella sp. TaxID=1926307 RepID=UPI0025F39155|nr:site-2 protease family protein [Veillonella sp.]MBS4914182.1 site-2 protease family protein [Veillonella sp.]
MDNYYIMSMIAALPAIVVAMSVHEYAHAQVATWLGDDTPARYGRLTLNPFAHVSWLGFLMILLLQFGWAKPVIINPANFKNKKLGDVLVSVAGPIANLIIAFIAAITLVLTMYYNVEMSDGLVRVLRAMLILNINFAIFNLLPIPPLDGAHIVSSFLSPDLQMKYWQWQRFSFIILIILIYSPLLSMILIPMSNLILKSFTGIAGLILYFL